MRASALSLASRQLARDFRAGELRLLLIAVTLAVAALTAVGFFADRLDAGLARDARQLLGGDAVVAGDHPPPDAFTERARALGLTLSTNATFPSMARASDAQGGAAKLVSVKAVNPGYPLRGRLTLADQLGGAPQDLVGIPERGTVWADAGLLDSLSLKVGDELLLGDFSLRLAKVIVIEPDRGAGFGSFAPRVMLNAADLDATGLIQPASRVSWRLAVAAPGANDAPVRDWVRWVEDELKSPQHRDQREWRGLRVESLEAGRPEMRQTLDRASKFLNLVALLSALLAAVAVGIASRDFADRHLDDCAMLRVLGCSQRTIAGSYLIEFAAVGALASLAGAALGFAVHYVFVMLLAGILEVTLPAASLWPALLGLGVGMTLLFAFGAPPVLQLARVPALRVMRRDVGERKAGAMLVFGAGAAGFIALLMAVSADLKLGAIAIGGFAAAIVVFALASYAAVALLRRAVPESRAPRWLVLATRQIAARPALAVVQVSALAVGLLALMLLVLLRTDLIDSWRAATPTNAPNRFVINIQPDQNDAFHARLDAAGIKGYDWYPMIRGRLVTVNDKPVSGSDYTDERARRLVEREFNLSHSAQLPGHNEVTAGRWTPDEADGASVESGLAETLGLKLGDTLTFDIAGARYSSRITSLRKVDWGSMRVNFFVMFPRSAMPELPTTTIAAYRAPTPPIDNALAREFPNITSIDVTASITQVQKVLDQVIRAVEFLFGFTLAAGLVVLFAAVSATREQRAREFAIMRAMGASSVLLARVQRAELLGVGALAGTLASFAAMAVGWALARYVFEFSWSAAPWVPLLGAAAGALLALAAGWWGLREVLRRPVMQTLRQAAS